MGEISVNQSHPIHPIEQKIFLKFDMVSFSYRKVKVLEDASFHIHKGEFIALVGPNGSGKTTIIKLILGLEKVQSGKIEISGSGIKSDALGYVPQQLQSDKAFPITVRDVVKMGRLKLLKGRYGKADMDAVDEALEQTEISELALRSYNDLSGGQKRRVLAARALASRPEILILDEPAANMDSKSESKLFSVLGKLKGNSTVLIVTHDMEFVSSLTDRVLCIGGGFPDGRDYGIVQHRVESSRVIHGESIPADDCYTKVI